MKFLCLYTPDSKTTETPLGEDRMAEMNQLIEEWFQSGALLTTGGLLPMSWGGARLRRNNGEITVVDGPFTEAKELVGGFGVFEANSREQAIEMTRRFLAIAGDGESDLHQMMEPGAAPSKV
jgi:hypothetical protein